MKKLCAILRLAETRPKRGKCGELFAKARAIKAAVSGDRDEHIIHKLAEKLGIEVPQEQGVPKRASDSGPAVMLGDQCKRLLAVIDSFSCCEVTWMQVKRRHCHAIKMAKKSLRKCVRSEDGTEFHRWRKRVKTLYYQSLALHEAGCGYGRLLRLRELAHKLGDEHDLSVLAGRLHADVKSRKRVEKKRKKLHKWLCKLGRRLFGGKNDE